MQLTNKETFSCEAEKVWEVLENLSDCSWRRNIREIEVISDTQFVEISKEGYRTSYTIVEKEECKSVSLEFENENMHGSTTMILCEENGVTTAEFWLEVLTSKSFMKPFVKAAMRISHAEYLEDLQKALENKK